MGGKDLKIVWKLTDQLWIAAAKEKERPCFNKMEGKKWFSKDVFWPLPVHRGMLISAPKISNKEILFIKILEISIKIKNKK